LPRGNQKAVIASATDAALTSRELSDVVDLLTASSTTGQPRRQTAHAAVGLPCQDEHLADAELATGAGIPPASLGSAPSPRSSKLDAHTDKIKQLLQRYPKITAQRVLEELKRDDYDGGNALDLWSLHRPLPIYAAALEIRARLHQNKQPLNRP